MVGCWGPAAQQTNNVSCSTNSCPKSSTSNAGKASLTAKCGEAGNGSSGGNGGDSGDGGDITTPRANNGIK